MEKSFKNQRFFISKRKKFKFADHKLKIENLLFAENLTSI